MLTETFTEQILDGNFGGTRLCERANVKSLTQTSTGTVTETSTESVTEHDDVSGPTYNPFDGNLDGQYLDGNIP